MLDSRILTDTKSELLPRAGKAFGNCYLFSKIFIKNSSLSVRLKIKS